MTWTNEDRAEGFDSLHQAYAESEIEFLLFIRDDDHIDMSSGPLSKLFKEYVPHGTWKNLFNDIDRQSLEKAIFNVRKDRKKREIVRVTLTPKGNPTPYRVLVFAIEMDEGVRVWMSGQKIEDLVIDQNTPLSIRVNDELLTFLNVLVIIIDNQGRFATMNGAMQRLMGYDRSEIEGKDSREFIRLTDGKVADIAEIFDRLKKGGAMEVNLPIITRAGKEIPLHWRFVALFDQFQKHTGLMGMAFDPTGIWTLEKEVNAVSSQIERLSRSPLQDEIDTVPLQAELIHITKALDMRIASVRLEGKKGEVFFFHSGADAEIAERWWRSEIDGKTLVEKVKEFGHYWTDDREHDANFHELEGLPQSLALFSLGIGPHQYGEALFAGGPSDESIMAKTPILQIFTNQLALMWRNEQDKQELRQRNVELQTLFETSQTLASSLEREEVLAIIARRALEMISAEACFIFGADRRSKKLKCLAVQSLKEQVDPSSVVLDYGQGLSGLVAETGEGVLIKRADMDSRSMLVDGTDDTPSSVISVPLKVDGELLGVMTLEKTPGAPFNEGEYQLMELYSLQAVLAFKNSGLYDRLSELLQSQQMYNTLLTHDVANYNVPIHGFLEMLLKDPKLDERQRRFIRSSLTQSENISSLISDVRKLWWLRTMERDHALKPTEMIGLIRNSIESLNAHSLYHGVEIWSQYEKNEAWVEADMFLRDVIYNLLSNACKYGEQQPVKVWVRSVIENGKSFWRVEIEDQGKGIPDSRKHTLFNRFDQMDGKTAAEGHGLGLSVVYAFTIRYGGSVWVENRVQSDWTKGSRFILSLPMTNKRS